MSVMRARPLAPPSYAQLLQALSRHAMHASAVDGMT